MISRILPSLFIVTFEDNSRFFGGNSYFDTKWREIPRKKIKRILYRLPDGNYLSIKDFDKYYHMIEAVTDLNGKNAGMAQLQFVYLMGKKNKKVTVYKIPLRNKIKSNFTLKDITKIVYNETDKKIIGLNPTGWVG